MDKQNSDVERVGLFLPDFCRLSTVFTLLLAAELLAFVMALVDSGATGRFWGALGLYSLFVIWVALLSAVVLCRLKGKLARLSDVTAGFVAFVVIQSLTILLSLVSCYFFAESSFAGASDINDCGLFRNLAVSCIVSAVLLRYLFINARWARQVEAEHEARLEALQARMRPHFLFNSFNTIASLIRSRPTLAEELVFDLAELFRASLKKGGKLVSVNDELVLCRQYLNIEQQRLGERLRVSWELVDLPESVLIPPLTLQPLVENAIYHGIEKLDDGGDLVVSSQISKGKALITVRNSIADPEIEKKRLGNNMALENLRSRLEGCFGGEGKLMISTADGFYQVRLVLPCREIEP